MFFALLASLLLTTSPQSSEPAAEAPAERPQPERTICKRERVVGSNRPQRICMTAREWTQIRETSRDQIDRATREQPVPLPQM